MWIGGNCSDTVQAREGHTARWKPMAAGWPLPVSGLPSSRSSPSDTDRAVKGNPWVHTKHLEIKSGNGEMVLNRSHRTMWRIQSMVQKDGKWMFILQNRVQYQLLTSSSSVSPASGFSLILATPRCWWIPKPHILSFQCFKDVLISEIVLLQFKTTFNLR